jgi:biopolymer transport protein ExbB/TolQ
MTETGAFLKTFIYMISSSLLYPVLLFLVLLTLLIIVYAGSFFAEWLERARLQPYPSQQLPDLLNTGRPSASVSHRVNHYIRTLHQVKNNDSTVEIAVENMLQETTLKLWKSMDRLRILVRAAPSLGLIGTLIPMGTGLAALGQGDMTKLTTDLVIAFTTTVVGLAIGTTAFFMYTIRRRWIEEDIKNIELATELFMTNTERIENEVFSKTANEKNRQSLRQSGLQG